MCRSDDGDYEWYVDATIREVLPEGEPLALPLKCEDCGRTIETGEAYIRYTCLPGSEWDDDRPYVTIVFKPWIGRNPDKPSTYWIDGLHWVAIHEGDVPDPILDYYISIGLTFDEERDPRLPAETVPDHFSCVQCKAAERWLNEVCSQHMVLVTKYDLIEHTNEYDFVTLGTDFMALAGLARKNWYDDNGGLVPEGKIAAITEGAIKHAVAVGMHPD